MLAALMAGEIEIARLGVGTFASSIKAGKVKALAVDGERRNPAFPTVPTETEAGLGDFSGRQWLGMFVPTGTPDPIIARLNNEMVQVVNEPSYKAILDNYFQEPAAGTQEAFAAFLKADRVRAEAMIKLAKSSRR